jgi:NTP pyrophosphatase (non-canonical NTP hydrolase)
MSQSDFTHIMECLEKFRDERDWKQFHDPKNLSLALSIEAGELNELFLWKKETELDDIDTNRIQDELADVLSYAMLLVNHYGFDMKDIITNKIVKNSLKYPVEKFKGSSKKYNEL